MGRPRVWLAVEPVDDSVREQIVSEIEKEDGMHERTTHDDTLIFEGLSGWPNVRQHLANVAESVDHAVGVQLDDTVGSTHGAYYECDDGGLVEVESLLIDAPLEEQLFDYFATEYGIHVPV